MKAFSRWI